MTVRTVGILSPGDMGHSVGAVLRQHGLRVLTCLAGRSDRTLVLAAKAGFQDTSSLARLVSEVEMLLCILVPAAALEVAQQVAQALRETAADLLYVDCNAIAPNTARAAGRAILEAGGRFADGGIIGSPPPGGARIYTSGPGAAEFAELSRHGLDIRVLEGDIGQASGLKICYGALTKGLQALGLELLVAARAMGLEAALRAEQTGSLAGVIAFLERALPIMPPKAHRWIGEMQEIAACFESLGMTPKLFEGVADMYAFVAQTPLGQETPESRDRDRDLKGVIAGLASALGNRA